MKVGQNLTALCRLSWKGQQSLLQHASVLAWLVSTTLLSNSI